MPPARSFVYDPRLARYRDRASGRLIPASQVRAWLDSALDSASVRFRALAEQLQRGQIDLISWQVRMAREVKLVQLYSAAAAKGGWAQLSPSDLGRAGRAIQDQLRFLNGFARDVRTGKQPIVGLRFLQRAESYAFSGRATYHKTERLEQEMRGMTEEKSIKYGGDSCPGCINEAARQWVPIGSLIPVGSRNCLYRCRCSIAYR